MTREAARRAVRQITVHSALQSFVEGAGALFGVGFMVRQGLTYPQALAAFAGVLLVRYATRWMVLPLAIHNGLRGVLILGVVVRAAAFAVLPFVTGLDGVLLGYVLLSGLGNVLYWTAYHAVMSELGDDELLGRQVSVQMALNAMIGIAAPLAGGLALESVGPLAAFGGIALIQLLAALPLLAIPNPAVPAASAVAPKLLARARWLYLAEGLQVGCSVIVWNLALFATLGESYGSFGGAMAAAGLGAAMGSLVIGRLFDRGRGHHSLPLAYGLAVTVIAAKGLALNSPWAAIAASALGAMVGPMTATALLLPLYTMARESGCVLRFTMATEGGWDLGCVLACLMAAALLQAGHGFQLPVLLALAGIAWIALLLRRWYAAGGAERGVQET